MRAIAQGHTFVTREMLDALGLPFGAVKAIQITAECGAPVDVRVQMMLFDDATKTYIERFKHYRLLEVEGAPVLGINDAEFVAINPESAARYIRIRTEDFAAEREVEKETGE